MGLFDRFKKVKIDWDNAFAAYPNFYVDEEERQIFGAIALTENTDTVLKKEPQYEYSIERKPIKRWKMVFVSTTKDAVIGECDYFEALEKLESYILDSRDNTVLVRGLSLEELESLLQ